MIAQWLGALLAPITWAIFHTSVNAYVSAHCTNVRWWLVPGFGLVALAVIGAGALLALRTERAAAGNERARLFGRVGLGASALFALVVIMQVTASFMVDPCD
jgi:hypothetical protein